MTQVPHSAVVWAEIPVTDMARSTQFYRAILGHDLIPELGAPNPMANFAYDQTGPGTSGHIYPGKPAADGQGPTVHLAVPGTVEQAMEACSKAGGTVISPVITIPPGRFAYAKDPDGNSIGLFEPKA